MRSQKSICTPGENTKKNKKKRAKGDAVCIDNHSYKRCGIESTELAVTPEQISNHAA